MAFVKFMRNKFFHPHTFENQKRTWIAEQKHESEKKKQEDLHKQYIKEQAIYENKNLLKHGKLTQDDKLSFMYEPPLECRKKDDKLELREVRFEWQKNAPRAGEYAKNIEVTDCPFGIEVRNTKCIKCGVWGHMNTDKICPLFNQGLNTEENPPELGKEDPMALLNSMEQGGLKMRKHAVNAVMDVHDNKYRMLEDEKLDPEVAFIANLTDKQKRKLMRKLNDSNSGVGGVPKAKHKRSKKSKKNKSKHTDNGETFVDSTSDKIKPARKDTNEYEQPNSPDVHRSRHINLPQSSNDRKSRRDDVNASSKHRNYSSDNQSEKHKSHDNNRSGKHINHIISSRSRSPKGNNSRNYSRKEENRRNHSSLHVRRRSSSKHRHESLDSQSKKRKSPDNRRVKQTKSESKLRSRHDIDSESETEVQAKQRNQRHRLNVTSEHKASTSRLRRNRDSETSNKKQKETRRHDSVTGSDSSDSDEKPLKSKGELKSRYYSKNKKKFRHPRGSDSESDQSERADSKSEAQYKIRTGSGRKSKNKSLQKKVPKSSESSE